MERHVELKEISDGKLYSANDMAKLGCLECKGCSACCMGMGDSIVLDPLDCFLLERGLGMDFSGLLQQGIELGFADGLIFPHLKMQKETDACFFLDKNGRCSVHAFRPGFCRLYPLGRYYHDDSFSYIMLKDECKKENRTKLKVKKWLGYENTGRYEDYALKWHRYWKELESRIPADNEEMRKQTAMQLLREFYLKPWTAGNITDFYEEFNLRLLHVLA